MNNRLNDRKLLKPKSHKRLIILFILIAVFAVIIILNRHIQLWQRESIIDIIPFEKSEIFICYSKNMEKLEKKILEVKKGVPEKERAHIIIRELKKEKNIPENTSLYEFASDGDGTIYLNLSKDILGEKAEPAKEIITVYSIINSFLLSFKDAKKVQLLVEGQPVYTINGTVYTYKPIEFNKYVMED
ncbi:MAG: GerMN domain-containing protein [Proteobacteria bacterium]|nr:GerMN domain-containing protein [Pseudomonadota bacterium]